MNETLEVIEGRHVLRIERWFPHPVAKVWRAITDPQELRHWFPARVVVDLRPDGVIRFLAEPDEGPQLEGRVLEVEPPHRFCFSWGDSELSFELWAESGERGPGCRMRFRHTFDDRVSAASYAAGWQICFDNLYLLVEGKPSDVGLDQWAALHDGYVEQFDLDSGTVDSGPAADGGWVVRFERQLTRAPDEVWQALTEGATAVAGGPAPPGFMAGLAAPALPGPVTEVDPARLLAARWSQPGSSGGQVRWTLGDGNGGARLLLTQTSRATGPTT